jgi:hypothetical protein
MRDVIDLVNVVPDLILEASPLLASAGIEALWYA